MSKKKKYVSECAKPTPHQSELLTILSEECLEVIKGCLDVGQRASKLQRFGGEEVQSDQPYTNSQRLGHEIGDLLTMVNRIVGAGIVTEADIMFGMENKSKQLEKYMQTQP